MREVLFYLTFGFLWLRLLRNKRWIFSKVVKILDFWILSGWIEKYKPALSKSDSSWDNSYCVRLGIASLAVNIGKLQSLVREDNLFCRVYNDFCCDLNNRHPNIKFMIEKQINHSIAFLDVFISGINNQNLKLQTYRKSTSAGLLLNFKIFTSFSYKISLIKCLTDRSLKICNNWNSLDNDIENIKPISLKMHIRHS